MEESFENPQRVLGLATQSIQQSVGNVFNTMLGVDAEVGDNFIASAGANANRTVAGVIGWIGQWNGTGIVECSPECACMIANLMLGTEGDMLNEDSLDAVAEIANMIFGGMKTEMEEHIGAMGLSTPTVIYGNDVGMRSAGDAFTIIPVRVGEHAITIKLYMVRANEKHNGLNHLWAASCAGAA